MLVIHIRDTNANENVDLLFSEMDDGRYPSALPLKLYSFCHRIRNLTSYDMEPAHRELACIDMQHHLILL